METVINKKAKDTLTLLLRESLAAALSSAGSNLNDLSPKTVALVSIKLVDHLMIDDRFTDLMSSIAHPKEYEFLTTEGAARLSGFSRPFIISLLDGPLYAGRVIRTAKGHRRVLRGEFTAWLASVSLPKYAPETIKDVRSGPRDAEPVARKESATQKKARLAAKAETMEFARAQGLF